MILNTNKSEKKSEYYLSYYTLMKSILLAHWLLYLRVNAFTLSINPSQALDNLASNGIVDARSKSEQILGSNIEKRHKVKIRTVLRQIMLTM